MTELSFPTHELQQLLEKFRVAQARADERAKVTHERFNVFTTLLEAHDEVRLHTRFLHCLLNPAEGTHDCDTLFLNLFFTTLKEQFGLNDKGETIPIEIIQPEPGNEWKVENEVRKAEHGQLDILMSHPGFGVAIENKIYAGEQDEQLARYASYLEKRHGKGRGLLLYLTLDGKKGETHAGEIPYLRISYAVHILDWLEKCLRETYNKIPINQALLQYRAVVLNLTGKNLNKDMEEISRFITENPDIIRFRKQIDEGIKKTIERYFDLLADEITKNLSEFEVRRPDNLKFGVDPFGALVIKKTPNHIIPFDIYIEYASVEEEQALYIGIAGDFQNQPPSPEQTALFDQMFGKLKALGYSGENKSTNWPTGWHTLTSGQTAANSRTIESYARKG